MRQRHDVFGPVVMPWARNYLKHGSNNIMPVQGYSHISSDPEICGGAPCISGSRIPVRTIGAYAQMGITPTELAEEYYPWLTLPEIYGALTYYYDHLPQVESDRAAIAA